MRIINASLKRNSMDGYAELDIQFCCHPVEAMDLNNLRGQEVSIVPKREGGYSRTGCFSVPKQSCCNALKKKETKVIFNAPYTILYMNGEKYISKAHNEEFDEEKGLLMCLAKANGITHLQLKRMIKNAKRQGDKK